MWDARDGGVGEGVEGCVVGCIVDIYELGGEVMKVVRIRGVARVVEKLCVWCVVVLCYMKWFCVCSGFVLYVVLYVLS